jgi:hypothetical protein
MLHTAKATTVSPTAPPVEHKDRSFADNTSSQSGEESSRMGLPGKSLLPKPSIVAP